MENEGPFSIVGDALSAIGAILSGEGLEPEPRNLLPADPPAEVRPLRLAVPGSQIDIAPEQLRVVRVIGGQGQPPEVFIALGPDAAGWLAETTTAYLGEDMAISVCGEVVLSPVIQTPITGGEVVISGGDTAEDAEDLARLIAGQAPCPEAPDAPVGETK